MIVMTMMMIELPMINDFYVFSFSRISVFLLQVRPIVLHIIVKS